MKKSKRGALFGADLAELMGVEWREVEITPVGLLLPGWKRPFSPGELRSVFMRLQLVALLEHENTRLRVERGLAWEAQEAAQAASEYYRSQLRLESRLGAMLQGFTA